MNEDVINFDLPSERSAIIKVVGIGGGGVNAVNHMYEKGIKDVDFMVCNTDHQALERSTVPTKVQIGESITEGHGAGSRPEVGRQAALENINEVMAALSGNTKMVILTTGMGGGTGTGATPVIAKACKDAGLLTIAVVTIPFKSEGKVRIRKAIDGISELKDQVDSLLVINIEKLREIYCDMSISSVFTKADEILTTAVKGIAEIITVAGYINVDFADVESVMKDSGIAIMGMGQGKGEDRALKAIENTLTSPLLNSNDIIGAKSILINISSGTGANELTMDELGDITDYIYEKASKDTMIIRGISQDKNLGNSVSATIIATGFSVNSNLTPDIRLNPNPKDKEENKSTFQKIRHLQNLLKKEGLSNKIVKDNIENLEDVPAFIRRNISLISKEKEKDCKVSKFTMQSDEDNEPILISNNPYLNDLEKKEGENIKTTSERYIAASLKKVRTKQKQFKKGNSLKKTIKGDKNNIDDIPVNGKQRISHESVGKGTESKADLSLKMDSNVSRNEFQTKEKQIFDRLNGSTPYDFSGGKESDFHDLVFSSVFAPEQVIRNKNFTILVFLHTKDQKTEVKDIAHRFDKALIQKAFQYLDLNIKIGTRLTFELILYNVTVQENKKSMVWLGDPSYVDFEINIPESFKEDYLDGKIIICMQTIPVGKVKFRMNIVEKRNEISGTFAETRSYKYRNAFISYSSHDRKEVIKRINLLSRLDVNYFWDLMTLKPGDKWRDEIFRYIEKSDVFFLFWSNYAKKSNWVIKEWRYALEIKKMDESKPPDIIPIVIEGPPPPKPPKELCHLHFNDPMIYFGINNI